MWRSISSSVSSLLVFWLGLPVVSSYEQPPVEPGFSALFDGKDLTKHFVVKGNPASWKVLDGIIVASAGGDRLMSRESYGDFVLRLEWKISREGNSGVSICVPSQDDGAPWETGYEVQISNAHRDDSHSTGSLYGVAPVNPRPNEDADVWHRYEITCIGNRIRVKVDGVECVDADRATNSNMRRRKHAGFIGLQDYHAGNNGTIEYRNLRIARLNSDGTLPGFTDLRDPQGWQKIKTGHGTGGDWRFEEAWIGRQDPVGSGNGGVNATRATFGDFELVVEAKPYWGCDSGIFLRSTPEGKCYQILVDYYGSGNVGGIYGEGTGGFNARSYNFNGDGTISAAGGKDVLPLPFRPEDWGAYWNKEGYNDIRARIRGNPPVIDVWLNGAHLTHFEDKEERIPLRGHLGLQVHGGKSWPAEGAVRYRNIQVREIE